jgi:TonB family protein
MAVHSPKPFGSQEIITSDRDSLPEPSSSSRFVPLDAASAVSSLKDAIKAGYHGLDPTLEAIADVACVLTNASGAALAMWKDGAMVCRARSGESSPPLGAQLDAETGISGECLRTGKLQHCTDAETDPRVDAVACRSRGLRSIAVLPIQSKRETNGILLTFSTQPAAFTDSHIDLLRQLASLAELARASKLESASSAAAAPAPGEYLLPLSASATHPPNIDLQPMPDRLLDVALASVEHRSRPIVLGAIVVAAAALLILAIWLGWHAPQGVESRAHPGSRHLTGSANVAAAHAPSTDHHLPDNEVVWKPNPGGESLLSSGSKTAVDNSVELASQLDKTAAGSITASIIISDRVPRIRHEPPAASRPESHSDSRPGLLPNETGNETASTESPRLPPDSAAQSNVNSDSDMDMKEVLSPKVTLPEPPPQQSQGVSGGQLLSSSSVLPDYPPAARRLRLEGEVVLQATVMEDGTVGDIKVIKGSPVLAQAAVDAVKHWRYQPYQLNGQPVKNDTKIVVEFTLPGAATR